MRTKWGLCGAVIIKGSICFIEPETIRSFLTLYIRYLIYKLAVSIVNSGNIITVIEGLLGKTKHDIR